MIIAISGYARSGKDSIAARLVERHGFVRRAFADAMREGLLAVDPLILCETKDPGETRVGLWHLSTLVEIEGWEDAKRHPEVRRLLQRFGTEFGRNQLGRDFWVEELFRRTEDITDLVIPDCRFPNEANATALKDGEVWRVTRPGVGPANSHASEISLDDYDFDVVISNNGNLNELADVVDALMEGRR